MAPTSVRRVNSLPPHQSNGCAVPRAPSRVVTFRLLVLCLLLLAGPMPASARPETEAAQQRDHSAGKRIASFLAGAATGLATHEAGHVVMNLALGEKPGIRKVDFHGISFFAITHSQGLPHRKEFAISSAGFWVQHAANEWLVRPPARGGAAGGRLPAVCSRSMWRPPPRTRGPRSRGLGRRSAIRAEWRRQRAWTNG